MNFSGRIACFSKEAKETFALIELPRMDMKLVSKNIREALSSLVSKCKRYILSPVLFNKSMYCRQHKICSSSESQRTGLEFSVILAKQRETWVGG